MDKIDADNTIMVEDLSVTHVWALPIQHVSAIIDLILSWPVTLSAGFVVILFSRSPSWRQIC